MTSNSDRTSHPFDVRWAERDAHFDVLICALRPEIWFIAITWSTWPIDTKQQKTQLWLKSEAGLCCWLESTNMNRRQLQYSDVWLTSTHVLPGKFLSPISQNS